MTDAMLFDLPDFRPTRPPEPILRAAEVQGPYRWTLSRRWGPGPLAAWCGCNPSDANAKRDDPTMRRVMSFAFRWGYGGVVMLNVYPLVTPIMAKLRDWRASELPEVDIAFWENIGRVAKAVALADLRIACWGNLPDRNDVAMLLDGVADMLQREPAWHCIGTTNAGAPTQPMARGKHRVPDDVTPVVWRRAA